MVIIPLGEISQKKETSTPFTISKTNVIETTSFDNAVPAIHYSKSDNSWSFSARVLEKRDVSIYGRPGLIARIQYVYRGEVREAWTVLKIDSYSFSDSASDIATGDRITLRVCGNNVSSKGVDWSKCSASDEFCQHASFVEGGFPTSEDYGGLTISPSNSLIYSGSVDDDWINGMLAWRIISEN
jgi:hypothetical protein